MQNCLSRRRVKIFSWKVIYWVFCKILRVPGKKDIFPVIWVFGGVATGKRTLAKSVFPLLIQNCYHHNTNVVHFNVPCNFQTSSADTRIKDFETLVVKSNNWNYLNNCHKVL
jgi:hypothetical protein